MQKADTIQKITNPENTNQRDIKHSTSLLFAKVEYTRRLATSPEIYKWDRCVFSVDPLNLSSGWSGIDFWQNTKWKMQWAFPRVHKCIPSSFQAHSETLSRTEPLWCRGSSFTHLLAVNTTRSPSTSHQTSPAPDLDLSTLSHHLWNKKSASERGLSSDGPLTVTTPA